MCKHGDQSKGAAKKQSREITYISPETQGSKSCICLPGDRLLKDLVDVVSLYGLENYPFRPGTSLTLETFRALLHPIFSTGLFEVSTVALHDNPECRQRGRKYKGQITHLMATQLSSDMT